MSGQTRPHLLYGPREKALFRESGNLHRWLSFQEHLVRGSVGAAQDCQVACGADLVHVQWTVYKPQRLRLELPLPRRVKILEG